jgi:hypothetical protein
MKCLISFLIVLISFSCSTTSTQVEEEIVLFELNDSEEKPIIKVITGYYPGEDVYLTISHFEAGKLKYEYGAYPYGTKYRKEFQYDSLNRLIAERNYSFETNEFGSSQIETYPFGKFQYSIADTLVDFSVIEPMLTRKIEYRYHRNDTIVEEVWMK